MPGQLGNMTMTQVHTLEKLRKELKAEGKLVEERMNDAMLLRCAFLSLVFRSSLGGVAAYWRCSTPLSISGPTIHLSLE
jgi:hypothetical protein